MILKKLIVVTDLDGTLLDHHSYSFAAAQPALRRLAEHGIPLVLNSSKTAAELLSIRKTLNNHEPFVVENGAGIFVPGPEPGDRNLEKIVFGVDRVLILEALTQLRQEQAFRFTGFADMSVGELCGHTGLTAAAAERALARDFSEPILWRDSVEKFSAFRDMLRERGIATQRGGRFIHLAAPVDKGMALAWLKRHYGGQAGQGQGGDRPPPDGAEALPLIIALGDGDNDRAMLESADYPVLVRSPVHEPPAVRHGQLLVTERQGPAGWNQAVLDLLRRLGRQNQGKADKEHG